MTRIRCRDRRCVFNKNGICTSEEIEYEPDAGCLTMEPRADVDDDEVLAVAVDQTLEFADHAPTTLNRSAALPR